MTSYTGCLHVCICSDGLRGLTFTLQLIAGPEGEAGSSGTQDPGMLHRILCLDLRPTCSTCHQYPRSLQDCTATFKLYDRHIHPVACLHCRSSVLEMELLVKFTSPYSDPHIDNDFKESLKQKRMA